MSVYHLSGGGSCNIVGGVYCVCPSSKAGGSCNRVVGVYCVCPSS